MSSVAPSSQGFRHPMWRCPFPLNRRRPKNATEFLRLGRRCYTFSWRETWSNQKECFTIHVKLQEHSRRMRRFFPSCWVQACWKVSNPSRLNGWKARRCLHEGGGDGMATAWISLRLAQELSHAQRRLAKSVWQHLSKVLAAVLVIQSCLCTKWLGTWCSRTSWACIESLDSMPGQRKNRYDWSHNFDCYWGKSKSQKRTLILGR